MTNFRTLMYSRYVSTFKESESLAQSGEASFEWYKFKYLPLLNLNENSTILDLGCGSGTFLRFLTKYGFGKCRGIDISTEQIALATAKGCAVELADVFEYLRDLNEKFDAIIAIDFIEHFDKEELAQLASLINKSLKEGGRFILQTPNGAGLFSRQVIYGDLTHMTIFTTDSIQQLLKQAGFREFRFLETGPVPKNAIGILRLLAWRIIKSLINAIRRIESNKSQTIWTENLICLCLKRSSASQSS